MKTIEELEKEIERLKIRVEMLAKFLNAPEQPGAPNFRQDYGAAVREELDKRGL